MTIFMGNEVKKFCVGHNKSCTMFAGKYHVLLTIVPSILFACIQSTRSQLSPTPLSVDIEYLEDFYMTDPISRASQTMAKCIAAVKEDKTKNNY